MRNLANMVANNWWLDTPEEVEADAATSRNGEILASPRLGDARGPANP